MGKTASNLHLISGELRRTQQSLELCYSMRLKLDLRLCSDTDPRARLTHVHATAANIPACIHGPRKQSTSEEQRSTTNFVSNANTIKRAANTNMSCTSVNTLLTFSGIQGYNCLAEACRHSNWLSEAVVSL